MARRRSSTALFEVIHAGKIDGKTPRPSPAAALRTPRWWFKGAKGRDPDTDAPTTAPERDPNDPTANVTAATLLQSRHRAAEPAATPAAVAPDTGASTLAVNSASTAGVSTAGDAVPVSVSSGAPAGDSSLSPVAISIDDAPVGPATSRASSSMTAAPAKPLRTGSQLQMAFDPDRHEVTLRMRYTAALVTAFTVLVIIGLAYVIGRKMGDGPKPASAADGTQSSAAVKKGPPQPGVLDPQRSAQQQPGGGAPRSGVPAPLPRPAPGQPGNGNFADAPIAADGIARRINNMNYMIFQSYPDRKTAVDVRNHFVNNGIPCTVEEGSAQNKVTVGWWAVIGIKGFNAKYGSLPEYVAYNDAVKKVAAKFPANSKFNRVDPMMFKWAE